MRQVSEAKNAIWSNIYIEATLMWHRTKTRHPESVENPSLYMSKVSKRKIFMIQPSEINTYCSAVTPHYTCIANARR